MGVEIDFHRRCMSMLCKVCGTEDIIDKELNLTATPELAQVAVLRKRKL